MEAVTLVCIHTTKEKGAFTMNLKEFTEMVDHMTQQMNREQLQLLVHSIARKIPEENRKDFTKLLGDVQGNNTLKGGGKLKIDIKKRME